MSEGGGGAPTVDRAVTGSAAGYGLAGYGLAAVGMPMLTLGSSPSTRELVTDVVALAAAVVVAVAFGRWASRRGTAWFGPVLVALAALLLDVTPSGVSTVVLSVLAGAGVGLAVGPPAALVRAPVPAGVGLAAGVATLAVVDAVASTTAALVACVVVVTVAWAGRLALGSPGAATGEASGRTANRTAGRVLVGVAAAVALGLVAWTGANDPQLSWFGHVDANGPRDRREVAITFDDGPNDPYSLEIARILDEHGAKGTFFVVGKALDAEPDVARRLLEDGHLLGNHSYHHDYWRWLDPRYPELDRTQDSFRRNLGVCPRFFRPPHGQRTPFVQAKVAADGMRTVTWDVSAGDWATGDGELVARRVLRKVEPGSIILLHDSIDGDVHADRRVIVEALPLILEGLERKGLEPVTVDEMLGGPAYLEDC